MRTLSDQMRSASAQFNLSSSGALRKSGRPVGSSPRSRAATDELLKSSRIRRCHAGALSGSRRAAAYHALGTSGDDGASRATRRKSARARRGARSESRAISAASSALKALLRGRSVDPVSVSYLKGAEVDFVDTITGGGFTIKNPNATSTCGCGSSFTA